MRVLSLKRSDPDLLLSRNALRYPCRSAVQGAFLALLVYIDALAREASYNQAGVAQALEV